LLACSAQAAAYDWTAASGTTWATGWTGGSVPTINDDLTILGPLNAEGPLTINIAAASFANTINITNTSATTLANTTSGANRTLTLQNGLTTGSGAVTIGSTTANKGVPITLSIGSSQTWNIGSGGLTLNNSITRGTGSTLNFVTGSGVITTASALALNRGIFYNGDYALAAASGPVSAIVYGTTANTFNTSGAIGTVAGTGSQYNLTGAASLNAQNLGGGGTIRFGGNYALTVSGANTVSGFLTNGATAASITGSGSLRVSGEMVFATNGSGNDQLTVNSNVTTFNGGVLTTVTKSGAGKLVFSGNNTYNGDTFVNQGTLKSTSATGLGFGASMTAINLGNSKTTVASGATLDLAPASAMTVNEAITLNGGALTNSGSGTTTIDSGIAAVNLANLGTGSATSGTVSFGGTGSGATANVVITGGAISSFTLTNAGTGYTGATPVTFTTTGSTGAAATAILSSITLDGPANTIGGSGNFMINAAIANGTSSGGFSKIGAGSVTLNGVNTYTGGTTVSDGTLALGNAGALSGTGSVAVNGGTLASSVANVNLGTGDVSMSSGTLSAGGTAAGSFTLAADKNFTTSGGTLAFDVGTGFDRIIGSGTGTFGLTNTTLALTLGTGFAYTSTYALFSGFSGGSDSGLIITGYDSANWIADLSSSGILSFTSSAIPEPSTYAVLAGAALLGFAALRRRRA
ncbi:MAG TPA: autotransporter-associated beta strand repeat-containing protein, partial [Rariglobus sp.]